MPTPGTTWLVCLTFKDQWLSPLWFEAFGNALSVAEKEDAYLGYCDEYWWPSGQAAGRVLKQHPELAAQSLRWDTRVANLAGCNYGVASSSGLMGPVALKAE